MKKYEVTMKETSYGFVEVLAENAKEAKRIAEEMWEEGKVYMGGDIECVATKATVV